MSASGLLGSRVDASRAGTMTTKVHCDLSGRVRPARPCVRRIRASPECHRESGRPARRPCRPAPARLCGTRAALADRAHEDVKQAMVHQRFLAFLADIARDDEHRSAPHRLRSPAARPRSADRSPAIELSAHFTASFSVIRMRSATALQQTDWSDSRSGRQAASVSMTRPAARSIAKNRSGAPMPAAAVKRQPWTRCSAASDDNSIRKLRVVQRERTGHVRAHAIARRRGRDLRHVCAMPFSTIASTRSSRLRGSRNGPAGNTQPLPKPR